MEKTYKLSEVWEIMQKSNDFPTMASGYLSETLNSSSILIFFWILLFVFIIPSVAYILTPKKLSKKRNMIFGIALILSASLMNSITIAVAKKVDCQIEAMYNVPSHKTQSETQSEQINTQPKK